MIIVIVIVAGHPEADAERPEGAMISDDNNNNDNDNVINPSSNNDDNNA